MARAIELARAYVGQTAPNPAVGCVLVKNGKLVGEGTHKKAGTPHAEAQALKAAGAKAKGATAYVTLEPCDHFGKTPPCSQALIAAGVKRVVYGAIDPNPKVRGRGLRRLRQAGIHVERGPLSQECEDLIADFKTWTLAKRPYVIYKVASTLDGAVAIHGRGNWQISSPDSLKKVHHLRASCDAVLVGANTFRLDNPDLRPRLAKGGKQPLRVVVVSHLPPAQGKLAQIEPQRVLWICKYAKVKHLTAWQNCGAQVAVLGKATTPQRILNTLAARGVYRLLLEGGPTLAASFLRAQLIDRLIVVQALYVVNAQADYLFGFFRSSTPNTGTWQFKLKHTIQMDNDCWLEGELRFG